jgi:hypothetical protein
MSTSEFIGALDRDAMHFRADVEMIRVFCVVARIEYDGKKCHAVASGRRHLADQNFQRRSFEEYSRTVESPTAAGLTACYGPRRVEHGGADGSDAYPSAPHQGLPVGPMRRKDKFTTSYWVALLHNYVMHNIAVHASGRRFRGL